jgi:hypothetical protein
MKTANTNGQYEVLSPWAEADPVPLKSLSPRLADLAGKKIGLFTIVYKHASARVIGVIERRLKERFPTVEFSRYDRTRGGDLEVTNDQIGVPVDPAQNKRDLAAFEDWVKGVDAVVGAVGD